MSSAETQDIVVCFAVKVQNIVVIGENSISSLGIPPKWLCLVLTYSANPSSLLWADQACSGQWHLRNVAWPSLCTAYIPCGILWWQHHSFLCWLVLFEHQSPGKFCLCSVGTDMSNIEYRSALPGQRSDYSWSILHNSYLLSHYLQCQTGVKTLNF